jgi:hypothetical protein
MNDRTAAPARGAQRAKTARRGGPLGRLVVGEYVGQAAGDAARAVRRAGLRPGLDRLFGCEPELLGLIVAQEPAAGGDLARNGMVTLYVAAPGVAPVDEDTDALPDVDCDPALISAVAPQTVGRETQAVPAPARSRRRRKRGLAARPRQVFDAAPDPVPVDRGSTRAGQAAVAHVTAAQAWASEAEVDAPAPPYGEEYDEGVPDDLGDDELPHEEFVVHVDDLFAGRASQGLPAWRRVYPRRRPAWTGRGGHGARARLAEHPLLVRAAVGMLAVWAVVGVAAVLAGHPTHSHAASTPAPRAIREPVKTPAPMSKAPRSAGGSASVHARLRHAQDTRRPPRPAPGRRRAARPAGASVRVASAPPPAPSGSASAPVSPAPAQTRGGLFSP